MVRENWQNSPDGKKSTVSTTNSIYTVLYSTIYCTILLSSASESSPTSTSLLGKAMVVTAVCPRSFLANSVMLLIRIHLLISIKMTLEYK
jgi:hypothetical protein